MLMWSWACAPRGFNTSLIISAVKSVPLSEVDSQWQFEPGEDVDHV